MKKQNILVNLPPGFHQQPELKSTFARLAKHGTLRKTSCNTPDEIRPHLAWADAVLMWSWPALTDELLDQAPNLKFRGHLDLDQRQARIALDRGLPVSLTKRAWSPAVAEMALTLALGLLRRTSDYHAEMRVAKEKWVGALPDDINPLERQLTGRPVGIIGFGAIGRRVAELLAPFHGEVRIYDPYLPAAVAKQAGVKPVQLMDLIKNSDVVILCAANNPSTRHLIGKKEIAAFRKGAVFINVARSTIVDTAALVARLKKNDMFAAVDVFDKEPLEAGSPLRQLPNAYLTPHRAGGVMESVVRIISWVVDDYEAFLRGKELKYPLTEKILPSLDG